MALGPKDPGISHDEMMEKVNYVEIEIDSHIRDERRKCKVGQPEQTIFQFSVTSLRRYQPAIDELVGRYRAAGWSVVEYSEPHEEQFMPAFFHLRK